MLVPFLSARVTHSFVLKFSKFCYSSCSQKENENWPKRIFSGIQPTGGIHLGNYFGAIRKWKEFQDHDENVTISIVDLHSITTPIEPAKLKDNILNQAATLLACGLDPHKVTLFVQSSVTQHSELFWVLSCLTTMARLAHLPQYKEKSNKIKNVPLGLYLYPVLQAADIMVHKATHVPVGEDQLQHLQLAQYLAKVYNSKYGLTFPICEAVLPDRTISRIKSLRNPLKKMSKSDADTRSCIFLIDEDDAILEKIQKSVTDCTPEVSYDPEGRPGVSNLIAIYSIVSGKTIDEACFEARGIDTGKYKLRVADALIEHLRPIREKYKDYTRNADYLIQILDYGCERASQEAFKTMQEVKRKVGLFTGRGKGKDISENIINAYGRS